MTHLESSINDVKKFKATTPTNRRIKGRILHKLYHEEAVEKKQKKKTGIFRVTSVSLIAVRKGRVKRLRQMFHVSKRR